MSTCVYNYDDMVPVEERIKIASKYCAKIKFGKIGKCIEIALDVINGLWSGYPLCCIINFILLKQPRSYMQEFNLVKTEKDKDLWKIYTYVPCKKCFCKQNIVIKIRSGSFRTGWLYR